MEKVYHVDSNNSKKFTSFLGENIFIINVYKYITDVYFCLFFKKIS